MCIVRTEEMGVQLLIFAQPQYIPQLFPPHYLPLLNIRHPIKTSINTTPGSQTQ